MTPKEKAKELFDKFIPLVDIDVRDSNSEINNAKQCALIAVDEIWNYVAVIEQHETADFAFGGSFDGDEYFKYLQQVKQEILEL
jgi:hypothetical protein